MIIKIISAVIIVAVLFYYIARAVLESPRFKERRFTTIYEFYRLYRNKLFIVEKIDTNWVALRCIGESLKKVKYEHRKYGQGSTMVFTRSVSLRGQCCVLSTEQLPREAIHFHTVICVVGNDNTIHAIKTYTFDSRFKDALLYVNSYKPKIV